ncbi:FhuF-like iron-sulfur protein [Mumia flava]|uniref:FhuF-like iron-sulfur protein n=1 Tax=Mumia flava TaxID=1348852 RepID=A0A0B2BVB7_9ACTN|nr:(2Fe-2S)-binding protein [Mumia flava]PJJ58084.1 FhuF-like iron-sulfur protein [Mumia flava]
MSDPYAAVSALGPYFALASAPEPTAPSGIWRPLSDLLRDDGFDDRVAYTRAYLAGVARSDVEVRVAASTMSLGLFARLLSPGLGAAALGVALPPLLPDSTLTRTFETGPWPLAATASTSPKVAADDPVPALSDTLAGTVAPIVERLAERYAVSRTVLRGNAASALFGAVAALRATRPDLVDRAHQVARTLLQSADLLNGTGEVTASGFVRRSCCLYYRIPGGGYCGDCVLVPRT